MKFVKTDSPTSECIMVRPLIIVVRGIIKLCIFCACESGVYIEINGMISMSHCSTIAISDGKSFFYEREDGWTVMLSAVDFAGSSRMVATCVCAACRRLDWLSK